MKKEMLIIGLWLLAFLGAGTCIALTSLRSTNKDNTFHLPRIPSARIPILSYPLPPPGDTNDRITIRRFLQQMDSLRQDSTGHRLYDSICHFRPGLIDSARTAVKFYNLFNTFK